jgi:hypothetical protein
MKIVFGLDFAGDDDGYQSALHRLSASELVPGLVMRISPCSPANPTIENNSIMQGSPESQSIESAKLYGRSTISVVLRGWQDSA